MEKDAHCPVVDFVGVGVAHAHFGGHVFAGAAETITVRVFVGHFTQTLENHQQLFKKMDKEGRGGTKSVRRRWPSASRRQFSGFRSL